MLLSSDAQMFLIGLWTEADDQGIFEWKPITLRMRLRASKDGDVEPLLAEMLAANCICSYEIGGRKYGAVRNFRKYQRPKSPNAIHPINDEIRNYVCLSSPISEIEGDEQGQFPPNGEKSPQMEDGGKEVKKESRRVANATTPADDDFEEFWKAYPKRKGDNPKASAKKLFQSQVKSGADPKKIIEGVKLAASRNRDKIGTEFIPQAVKWLRDRRWEDHLAQSEKPNGHGEEIDWGPLVAAHKRGIPWPRGVGPQPGFGGCRVPEIILREHGYLPRDDTDGRSQLSLASA